MVAARPVDNPGMGRCEPSEELVRAACRRRVLPLARGMALLTPLIGVALLLVSRTASRSAVVVWLLLVAGSSSAALAVTRGSRDPGATDPWLARWETRYRAYVLICVTVWGLAPWVLQPRPGSPDLQTVQVLLLTTVGNSLVLLGAFLPDLSEQAVGLLSLSTATSLLVAGLGVNRWLATAVPVYAAVSWWMQGRLHDAATDGIRLALENERLVQRLARDQQVLEHEASHDQLTGLLNRAAFLERAQERVRDVAADDGAVAVAYLDLDGFKSLNDRHGHAVGDVVLATVATRLRAAVRADDLLARFGGDEFTLLLRDARDAEAAGARVVDALRPPVLVDGLAVSVGVSVGIAVASCGPADLEALLRDADAALYRAKANGRGRVEVHAGA